MHLIILTSTKSRSGGARQALYLAQGMAARGHTVHFFTREGSRVKDIAQNCGQVHSLDEAGSWRASIEAVMPAKGEPCVVHAFHNAAVKRVAWWGLFWKKRAVIAAHRGVLYRPGNPLPYWSPGIDCFLVNSEACARVLRGVGLPRRKARVAPNAVPDERLVPAGPPGEVRRTLGIGEKDLVFGAVVNNSPVKGVESLARAFARAFPARPGQPRGVLPRPEPPLARLLLVGCNRELWSDLLRELGIAGRVHIVPYTEDVAGHLAAMDVFVFSSLAKPAQESMPNTLLEALRMGLPAIGSRVAAVPEILENCGLLYPPGDVEALCAALLRMAEDPALRKEMAAAALREGDRYRPEVRLDLVESIYTELLRGKGLLP